MRYMRFRGKGVSQTTRRGKLPFADVLSCLSPRRVTHLLAILAFVAQSFVGLGQAEARLAEQQSDANSVAKVTAPVSDQGASAEDLLAKSTPFSSYIVVCTPDGLKKISLADSAAAADGNPLSIQPDCPVCIPAVQAGLAILSALPLATGFPKLATAPPAMADNQIYLALSQGDLHSRAPPLSQA